MAEVGYIVLIRDWESTSICSDETTCDCFDRAHCNLLTSIPTWRKTLRSQGIKQDAHTLNGTSIQRLERHVQKLANATQISFAERALLYDQNQMLTRVNNEAKVRRSTRSIVRGKAKVMSFEDIEVARAARAAKEVIKGKAKRGRKRKSTALEAEESEADEPEPEPKVARAAKEVINGRGKRGRKRKSAAQEAAEPEPEVAQMIDAPVPWKGTSCADDMRLLYEIMENLFCFLEFG
jgi:hypothetical protein